MNTHVLLVGGRSKAKSLALSLIKRGYRVTAINNVYDNCVDLASIPKLVVIHGDGTKPYILQEANTAQVDIAIALTNKDADNLVISQLCKTRFGVPKTVALVSDDKKTDFFYAMGIDHVISAIRAVTNVIEQQAFIDEISTVIPLGKGEASIVEVPVASNAPVVSKKLWEINLPPDVIIGCILRGETTIIPRGDTRILARDVLVVISGNDQELAAVSKLTGQ